MLHPSSTIVKILILTVISLHINLSAEQITSEPVSTDESTPSSMDLSSTSEQMESTTDLQDSTDISSTSEQIESMMTSQSSLASTSQAQIFTGTMETTTDDESSSIAMSSTTTVMPTTTASNNTVVNLTYVFIIKTNESLGENGNISNTETLANVTELIKFNVNTSVFSVKVMKISLNSTSTTARSTEKTFEMRVETTLTANRFVSPDSISSLAATNPSNTVNIRLPLANGTLVSISIPAGANGVEGLVLTSTNPPIKGESSPGLAARLGMGLGISFLAVLVIAEIGFFAWRFGFSKGSKEQNYAMAGLN